MGGRKESERKRLWCSGRWKMGKKLQEAQQTTADAGAGGIASRTRSGKGRAEPRPREKKHPSRPKIQCRAKHFDANVCSFCFTLVCLMFLFLFGTGLSLKVPVVLRSVWDSSYLLVWVRMLPNYLIFYGIFRYCCWLSDLKRIFSMIFPPFTAPPELAVFPYLHSRIMENNRRKLSWFVFFW